MSKRIFISDIHMGPKRTPKTGRCKYDRLNDTEKDVLVKFLSFLHEKEEKLTELVLVGDVLDNWICPHDEPPPSFKEIFKAHPEILEAIKALLDREVSVVFVEGNHDMHLAQKDLNVVFGSYPNLQYTEFYHSNYVYAAHGHSRDTFNNGASSNFYNLPLGYYISRAIATKTAKDDSFREPIVEVIYNSLRAIFTRDTMATAVFDTILKEAGLDKNISFLMPDGKRVTADAVREAYADVKPSTSIKDLRHRAKSLSDQKDINAVIFGHTHGEIIMELDLIDETNPYDYKKVYANSGTWSESLSPTYVEIEPKDNYESNIRLMAWKEGAPYKIDHKFFKT